MVTPSGDGLMALSTAQRGGLSFYRVGVNGKTKGILVEPSGNQRMRHPTTGGPMVGCCQPTAVRNI
jgi:hypothetical protein